MINIAFVGEASLIKIRFEGEWCMKGEVPTAASVILDVMAKAKSCTNCSGVIFDVSRLKRWDTSFISFTLELAKSLKKCRLKFDQKCLPAEMLNIINFASSSHPPTHEAKGDTRWGKFWHPLFKQYRNKALIFCKNLAFIGELIIESCRIFGGKSKFRFKEFWQIVEQVGVEALPIVALISFLVGLILAFVSILQLHKFGAGVYCADLVGISMMREMACLMTAVIMSGRTGAAFAATIGTMVVNEEIDAMRTTGLSCFEFIILPRIFALVTMMPLLCVFSDIIGICGGMFAAIAMLNMNITQYFIQTKSAIALNDVLCGLSKSVVFAILIASIGCLKGMQCGRDAEAVGRVTTSAVVASVTSIIVADAVFALIFNALGI
ncbi:MAG: ABC transporter permease [Puniceicoccales bacterium]|jgi:phospholipid/cholesterol/gamma-HCH transport system permease protein|nr:ABC transporter permease [Puniceicoccales bacterium]